MAVPAADVLLGIKDFKEAVLPMPEWGAELEIRIRSLSAGAVYAIAQRAADKSKKDGGVDAMEFAKSTVEFGLLEPKLDRAGVDKLFEEKSQEPIVRLVAEIWKLSDRTVEEAKNA